MALNASSTPRRIVVHDWIGHPFQAQLSRRLALHGHTVVHITCGQTVSGHGDLRLRPDDPPGLRFLQVGRRPFERYKPIGRLLSELRYGRELVAVIRAIDPQVVISANTPLLAQAQLWLVGYLAGVTRIYWIQDMLGRGARSVIAERSAILGRTLGAALERLEVSLLRSSDALVPICDDFLVVGGVRDTSMPVTVIENWAPLDEIGPEEKSNPWSRRTGLADRPVVLYSGTLGLKHDPDHLVSLARALQHGDVALVVITEGRGRDYLEEVRQSSSLDNLILLDFVDYSELGSVLGAADVCLVLLERSAGTFSVPSKVLTYLAAGKAVVGAIPPENLAARTIEAADAGTVVPAGDHEAFVKAVLDLLDNPDKRAARAASARAYAEATFDVEAIGETMEAVIAAATRYADGKRVSPVRAMLRRALGHGPIAPS